MIKLKKIWLVGVLPTGLIEERDDERRICNYGG